MSKEKKIQPDNYKKRGGFEYRPLIQDYVTEQYSVAELAEKYGYAKHYMYTIFRKSEVQEMIREERFAFKNRLEWSAADSVNELVEVIRVAKEEGIPVGRNGKRIDSASIIKAVQELNKMIGVGKDGEEQESKVSLVNINYVKPTEDGGAD